MIDEAHYLQAVSNSGKPDSQRAKVALRLVATSEFVYPITLALMDRHVKKSHKALKISPLSPITKKPISMKVSQTNYDEVIDGPNNIKKVFVNVILLLE